MTLWQFDQETVIVPAGEGRWTTTVSDQWNIGDNPNGGYLLSLVLRAMGELSSHCDPMTVTTHFLRPGSGSEPAVIEVDLVRSGRTLSSLRGRLIQGDKIRVEVMAGFSDLPSDATPSESTYSVEMPELPAVEDCVERSGLEQGVDLAIGNRVDVRLHPDQGKAGQVGSPVVSGWIRFADGRPVDSLSLPAFADSFPPALFGSLGNVGWVPTIELTVQVRRRPAPGWIRARFETTDLSDGRMIEDGLLWDSTGALVAHSRQLGLVL